MIETWDQGLSLARILSSLSHVDPISIIRMFIRLSFIWADCCVALWRFCPTKWRLIRLVIQGCENTHVERRVCDNIRLSKCPHSLRKEVGSLRSSHDLPGNRSCRVYRSLDTISESLLRFGIQCLGLLWRHDHLLSIEVPELWSHE